MTYIFSSLTGTLFTKNPQLCFEKIHPGPWSFTLLWFPIFGELDQSSNNPTFVFYSGCVNFVPHPLDSNLGLCLNQSWGYITLVSVSPPRQQQLSSNLKLWLDLSSRTRQTKSIESGLLSLVFHPRYAQNGRLFVSYTCFSSTTADCSVKIFKFCKKNNWNLTADLYSFQGDCPFSSCYLYLVLAEYNVPNPEGASESVPDPRESKRIFTIGAPSYPHHGGAAFFGNDGFLYLPVGDGAQADAFATSQNPKLLLGKILRVDVDSDSTESSVPYRIPPDNPFVKTPGVRPEIFAYGFRNPWQCSQDPISGEIICGDVGFVSSPMEMMIILKKNNNESNFFFLFPFYRTEWRRSWGSTGEVIMAGHGTKVHLSSKQVCPSSCQK